MGKVIKLDERLLKERIDARGNENLQNQRIGNAFIFVAQSGKTLYRGFFGESSFNSKRPPDENTLYRLASMTKPITAVAVLILKERGLLRLDDLVE